MSQGDRITRREFLQKAAVATGLLLAGGWPKLSAAKDETGKAALERRNEQEGMKYRRYGKTNLALSVLGIGGVAIAVEMYPRMIEAGMNYIQYYADPRLPELLILPQQVLDPLGGSRPVVEAPIELIERSIISPGRQTEVGRTGPTELKRHPMIGEAVLGRGAVAI